MYGLCLIVTNCRIKLLCIQNSICSLPCHTLTVLEFWSKYTEKLSCIAKLQKLERRSTKVSLEQKKFQKIFGTVKFRDLDYQCTSSVFWHTLYQNTHENSHLALWNRLSLGTQHANWFGSGWVCTVDLLFAAANTRFSLFARICEYSASSANTSGAIWKTRLKVLYTLFNVFSGTVALFSHARSRICN